MRGTAFSRSCLDFFKAEPIEHSATCGLILGTVQWHPSFLRFRALGVSSFCVPGPTKSLDEDMTSADALTRMGQLICRWLPKYQSVLFCFCMSRCVYIVHVQALKSHAILKCVPKNKHPTFFSMFTVRVEYVECRQVGNIAGSSATDLCRCWYGMAPSCWTAKDRAALLFWPSTQMRELEIFRGWLDEGLWRFTYTRNYSNLCHASYASLSEPFCFRVWE